MKQRLRIIIPVVLILALVGYLLWRAFGHRETGPPSSITGNGVIEATEVDLTSKVSGKILTLTVHEGDPVAAGELIATLESAELLGQVEQSLGNLHAAEANYAELKNGSRAEDIRKAREQYNAAVEATRQAQAQLALIRAGSREELIAQLRAAYQQAQAQLSLVKAGPRPEEIAQRRAALQQAEAQLSLVREGTRKEVIAQRQAELAQAQANLRDAQTELARSQKLYSQGAIAGQQVDQATTRRDVALAAVDAARQRLAEAQDGSRPQEVQEAQAAVEMARQRLVEAQNGARPQEIQQAQDAAEAARQRLREAENGPRPQERQQAEALVAQSQAQAAAARAALDAVVAGPRKEEITAAKARVDQARGQLATSDATMHETRVYAPSAGRVTLRSMEPGELVTPGMPIVRMAQLDKVWIRVYVPDPLLALVKIGQRAEVTTDATNGKRYAGTVIEIAEEPEFTPKNVQTKEERVKQVFGVKIELDNPNGELKPGMPGDAVIYVR